VKKLVLAVIDSLRPEMLDRAIAEDRAPALKALVERGVYVRDCVSAFPSITPVCAASIATGLGPDEHDIPSMNWYHRGEERYVEYGSSFSASRAFGIVRSLYDTIYNMNMAHLTRERRTVFEHLDDAGLRTACTTYLIYRGRFRHEMAESAWTRVARSLQFRHAVWGPRELFYADLYDSRRTGCASTLGLPGQRDQHAGCVGAHLVEHDLFDFLLLSLPDTDAHAHRHGPYAQVAAIEGADRALERIMHVAGGVEEFLEDHAVIVMSDHAQSPVEDRVSLAEALAAWRLLRPADSAPEEAELAVCPGARSAQVYILDPDEREEALPQLVADLSEVEGCDLLVWREGEEAVVMTRRGQLRFGPGGDLADARGETWWVEGEGEALRLELEDGTVRSRHYPDPLARLWAALACRRSGDVLVSAAPGYEFVDWGGADHVGGGSHGSLHRADSLGTLVMCGVGPDSADEREEWRLRDVAPIVLDHFGLAPDGSAGGTRPDR
jgi:hypothetical protein